MFAIISNKGDQLKVEPGREYKLDLGAAVLEPKSKLTFSDVLMVTDGDKVTFGNPKIAGASVEAEVIESGKTKKVTGIKFHAKKRYTRTLGHRQNFTSVKILNVKLSNEK